MRLAVLKKQKAPDPVLEQGLDQADLAFSLATKFASIAFESLVDNATFSESEVTE